MFSIQLGSGITLGRGLAALTVIRERSANNILTVMEAWETFCGARRPHLP